MGTKIASSNDEPAVFYRALAAIPMASAMAAPISSSE
jgi:hypothetical protein